MNDQQLRKQGARLSALYAFIGCALLMLSAFLVPILPHTFSVLDILRLILATLFLSLFSLPFSLLGGYALTWYLQKVQWHQYHRVKVVTSGVLVAVITLLVMLLTAGFLTTCVTYPRVCEKDFTVLIGSLFQSAFFLKPLFIAAICGGVTAWQLSRLTQQKTV